MFPLIDLISPDISLMAMLHTFVFLLTLLKSLKSNKTFILKNILLLKKFGLSKVGIGNHFGFLPNHYSLNILWGNYFIKNL